LFANAGIAIAKFIGFLITQSAGMLAESIHSLADTGNQALLLLGGSRAKKRATPDHPFGYGRERYFWSFAVSLVLFSVGGVFALREGIEKLRHPHEIESVWVAIVILIFAIILETFSLRTAIREANHVRPTGVSWWTYIRTSKQPELPVVLLEDCGAELGLFAALGGILMAEATGNPRWDAAGSVVIGTLLIVIAVVLMIEMKGLLIGESATPADQVAITAALSAGPGVRQVMHLKTEHIGPDEILVAAKLEFDESMTFEQLTDSIDATEAAIRAAIPAARVIYIEPGRR
jgi:cation diffusion facilitator family transporter